MNSVQTQGCLLVIGIAAGLVSPAALARTSAPCPVNLDPIAYRDWKIWLPEKHELPIGDGFAIAQARRERFNVRTEGEGLSVDLDGNGGFEGKVEGDRGHLTLRTASREGRELVYSVNLARSKEGAWKWTCGGAMVGSIGSTKIQFIDQNLNGSFSDYGEDAVVVGNGAVASFLSHVVSVEGQLFQIDVSADGRHFSHSRFGGDVGTLDLASKFESKGELRAAVVRSGDGQYSFDLAASRGGVTVPAGEYALIAGQVAAGERQATIRSGRAKAFTVGRGGQTAPAWGGPVSAEFVVARAERKLVFTPSDVAYYGRLGEEYFDFVPAGASPEFTVTNKATGELLAQARFQESCCSGGFEPIAVEIPANVEPAIVMKADNWAFGAVEGRAREPTVGRAEGRDSDAGSTSGSSGGS